ncbi:hypothetical protein ACFQU2_38605 [Siccirubricoccus deserti]
MRADQRSGVAVMEAAGGAPLLLLDRVAEEGLPCCSPTTSGSGPAAMTAADRRRNFFAAPRIGSCANPSWRRRS